MPVAAKRDPWLELGDPVSVADPQAQPPQPVNDEFANIGEPAQVVNTERTVAEGFDLPLPEGAAAKLGPDDEKEYVRILAEDPLDTAASNARKFLASKGFTPGPSTVEGFKGDSADQTVEFRRRHGQVSGNIEYLRPKPMNYEGGAADAASRGFGDVPTSGFLDEIGGLVDSLGVPDFDGTRENVFNSDRPFGDIVRTNIDINRGIIERDEKQHPLARISGQLLGGLAIPVGYETVGLRAGTLAMREARAAEGLVGKELLDVGRKAAAKAVRNAMTRDGVIIGGAHGVGSGEGLEGRVSEGLTEAGLGATAGAVAGTVGEVVSPRLAASRAAARAESLTEEQQMAQAAERQGIDLIPADVGGPVTRRATSMVTQTIAGGQPVIKASQRMTDQAQAARDRVAASIGQALEPEAAGQQALTGAKTALRTTADDARVFYNAAEKATVGERILTPKAISALDRNIAELEETPGGAPGLEALQKLRVALDDGRLTVAGVRRMRTIMRDQFIKDGLTGSDLERRVNQVVDAAAQDVQDQLRSNGLDVAAENFAKGDAAWRARAKLIDEVIEPIIGKEGNKSGEQVIKTLTADLQGNNARAVRFLEALPESERANVRASIIGALGRAKAGKQGSEGTDFSLDTFLTNWNQVGETAKRAYFGPEARAALNDLAQVAEGTREAQGYRNMSNTGGVVGNLLTLMSGAGGMLTFAKVVGTQYGLGRMLASPRVARWLARAPKARNPQAYIDKLGGIAKAEPAIAADVLSLQQRLAAVFSEQPAKLAAEPSDSGDSEQKPR